MNNNYSKMVSSTQIIEQITVDRLDDLVAENNIKIIDVRGPESIDSQGSIPGAINIPFDEVGETIDKRFVTPQSLFSSEGPFLFCCTGGVMSYMAAILAQEKGIKNVCNLEGGHSAWLQLKAKVV